MAMIGKVRRMHHRENKSVREIARATSLSRNTVRKYLRTPVAQPPKYQRRAVSTKLAPFVEMVTAALARAGEAPMLRPTPRCARTNYSKALKR